MRKNLWRLSWLYKDDNGNKNKKRDRETNTLNNPKINKGKNNEEKRTIYRPTHKEIKKDTYSPDIHRRTR